MNNKSGRAQRVRELERRWAGEEAWKGVRRDYTAVDVVKLQGSYKIEHSLARLGAQRLRDLLKNDPYVPALGAYTGVQAVQMVRAGLKAIYVSGWQVAADANLAAQTYPDLSLYPSNSAPNVVRRLNNALLRADQVNWLEGKNDVYWLAPLVADAESGFGGPVHAFELMRSMIDAGASGVHFEDQLAAEKKCGHMGGKVLVPTGQFIRTLNAARLAADVLDVPTVIISRTDALNARFVTSDIDSMDHSFITGERSPEGYYVVRAGLESAIARSLAYAPYADLLWFETSRPDVEEARAFAQAIHAQYPGKLLAYNCSPSFNWQQGLDARTIARFQEELAAMEYKFQFVTLAGWHLTNLHTFDLSKAYLKEGMPAYVRLQQEEFAREAEGYTATKHQQEVGTEYYDLVAQAISGGLATTTAMAGSTEAQQFHQR